MRKNKKSKEKIEKPLFDLIGLTEVQVQTLANALDFYSRIGACQFDQIEWMARLGQLVKLDGKRGDFDEVGRLCHRLKACFGLPPNASFGIYQRNLDEIFKSSYDIYKIIMYRLTKKRDPEGKHMNVHSSLGLFASKDKSRPDLVERWLSSFDIRVSDWVRDVEKCVKAGKGKLRLP